MMLLFLLIAFVMIMAISRRIYNFDKISSLLSKCDYQVNNLTRL